jgi:cytochrome bd ubiquinol oxidase subunit II
MAPVLAEIMVASLVLYVLLGGADYGAGFWDLLSHGPLKQEQRNLVATAIQPIWEANHVWLILILVLLFSGFPLAFGTIMIALHVPILLMLAGIVLRGSSFVFRAYSTMHSDMRRAFAYVFSISSCFTPFLFGMVLGSLSDDDILVSQDVSMNGYFRNWVNPFTLSVGMLTVVLFAFLAAAYLTVEAEDEKLRQLFRARGIAAGVAVVALELLAFVLSGYYARGLREGFVHQYRALAFALAAGTGLLLALVALYKKLFLWSRALAGAHAGGLVIAWANAQYPFLVRPDRTLFNSVLSENVIRDIVFACIVGAVILFPSLGILLYVFKDQRKLRAGVVSTDVSS